MRVLVTGATGLIGSAIVRELCSRGHAVRALVRATSATAALDGLEAERAVGDVLDATAIARAVAGCDAVVHTAGAVGFRAGDEARLFAVNVRGVEIVLGAALAAKVSRAVLTSSTAVLGGSRIPRVADESAPPGAAALGIPYFLSKLRGEEAGLALAARGLPLAVVRPAYVLGPGDRHGSSASILLALARRRIPAYVEGGASFCDVRDVARGHVEALLRGRVGEGYVLGGHDLTMTEMMTRVCAAAGVPVPRRLPYPVALAAASLAEAMGKVRGRRPGMTRALVRASALYTFVSSAKAERELGYEIRPFDEMVRDTLRWFLEVGRLEPHTPELRALAAA